MQGRRIPEPEGLNFQPGDYWKAKEGFWYAVTPNGLLANLAGHSITEHEDGTITAAPSIATSGYKDVGEGQASWHGYLKRGVWEEC